MGHTVIVGAGDQGRVALETHFSIDLYSGIRRIDGFLDDDPAKQDTHVDLIPVIGTTDRLAECSFAHVAIGRNDDRKRLYEKALANGVEPFNVIHPSATIVGSVDLPVMRNEGNVFIGAGAIINVGTRIGNNVLINTGAIVEHDCVIGDHAFISPGAVLCGHVTVGEGAFIGPGVILWKEATVPAGRTVFGPGTLRGIVNP